jgi:hypothetical protein
MNQAGNGLLWATRALAARLSRSRASPENLVKRPSQLEEEGTTLGVERCFPMSKWLGSTLD